MPRINMTGQEKPYPPNDWKEVQALLYMSFFENNPAEEKKILREIKKFLEEEQKDVRKDDRRNND